MKQWEVWQWEFPHGSHPAVIISPEARCANRDIATVNVLGCSTQRVRRDAELHEVLWIAKMVWIGKLFADAMSCSSPANQN